MAASYPGAVKTFSAIVNGVTKLVAALFNSPYDEITAIETELGTDVAGSVSDLKTRLAVSINNDGTLNPQFGTWADKSSSYAAQQAATDGYVVATIVITASAGNSSKIAGYTDAAADPSTLRGYACGIYPGAGYDVLIAGSFPLFVKKGDYWKIVKTDVAGTGTITVGWLPVFST